MQISTKSWHYRFLMTLHSSWDIPTSLCPYMRKVLYTLVAWVFFIGVGLLALAALLYPLAYAFVPYHNFQLFVFGCMLWTGAALGFGIVWLQEQRDKRRFARRNDPVQPEKPREPNVFWEYMKAKHRKVCPFLEFKEE